MKSFLKKLHPEFWTWRFFLISGLVLLAVNLFGPRGFIHWVLIRQEIARLNDQKNNLLSRIAESQNQMELFQKSDIAKFRAIREELGLLQKDELSVEFVEQAKTGVSTQSP